MNSDTGVIRFGRNMAASWLTSLFSPADTSYGLQGLIILILVVGCGIWLAIRILKERCRAVPDVAPSAPINAAMQDTSTCTPRPTSMNQPSASVQSISTTSSSCSPVIVAHTANVEINQTVTNQQGATRTSGQSDHASPIHKAASLCKEALKKLYTTTGSFVQLIPWADDDKKHIMDIYTDLELEDTKGKKKKVKSYKEILDSKTKEGHIIKRIICKGLPGYGKSTLLDKIAYDWAVGSVQELLKYELVIVLKMGALRQHSNLIDAIFDQLLDQDTPIKKSDLKSFIKSNPEKLLILLDGFDEFASTDLDETSFGSILKMLNRKEYRECCVVVTTRPSHFHTLVKKYLIEDPFTHVTVLGFNSESLKQYVEKFYSENPDEARELLSTIRSTDILYELAKSPMLVLLMCLLWRDDSKLPDTLTRIYEAALKYIFRRKSNLSESEISQILIQLGKIALEGLLYPGQMLSFQEGVFERNLLDLALKAGLLTKQRVSRMFDTQSSVEFIHKTFQEYCAGKYLQHLLEADDTEFQDILQKITKNSERFDYLLRFGCGGHTGVTRKVLDIIMKRESYLALNYYFECHPVTLIFWDFIESVFCNSISFEIRMNEFRHSFFWLLKRVAEDSNSCLSNVQELNIANWDLERHVDELRCGLHGMTQLTHLNLSHTFITGSDMNVIAQSFERLGNLIELTLTPIMMVHGSLTLWAHHLEFLKNLQILRIQKSGLYDGDIVSLVTTCGKLRALGECEAGSVDDRGSSRWIKYKDGAFCLKGDFTSDSLAKMFESLGAWGNIVTLHIASRGPAKAHFWAPKLKTFKQLRALTLEMLNLQSVDVIQIGAVVGDVPTLAKLSIIDSKSLGGFGEIWAPVLRQMRSVKELKMSNCSLLGQDIPHIVESLGNMSCLELLHLLEEPSDFPGTSPGLASQHIRDCALTDWSRLSNLKFLRLPWYLNSKVSEIKGLLPKTHVCGR